MACQVLRAPRLLVLLASISMLFAQTNLPPGSIDGSVNPERIPEVVAFRLFLGALSQETVDSAAENADIPSLPLQPSDRQLAKLAGIALSASDLRVLLVGLQAWQQKMPSTAASAPAATAAIDLDSITQSALDSLKVQMSQSGFASLLAHIRAEKRNMKRIPVPDMSKHAR